MKPGNHRLGYTNIQIYQPYIFGKFTSLFKKYFFLIPWF